MYSKALMFFIFFIKGSDGGYHVQTQSNSVFPTQTSGAQNTQIRGMQPTSSTTPPQQDIKIANQSNMVVIYL